MVYVYGQERFSREELVKEYLRNIFVVQTEKGSVTAKDLSDRIKRSYSRCFEVLSKLEKKGLLQETRSKHFLGTGGKGRIEGSIPTAYRLTAEGRNKLTVVLTGGAYDIIHVGHLATLNEAKRHGDVLIVVIARNETVKKNKGREPINDENVRVYIANNLRPVDLAVLGDGDDPYKVVKQVMPDVIALGYDQKYDQEEMMGKLRQMGLAAKVIRLTIKVPEVKTSNILSQIRQSDYDVNYI